MSGERASLLTVNRPSRLAVTLVFGKDAHFVVECSDFYQQIALERLARKIFTPALKKWKRIYGEQS